MAQHVWGPSRVGHGEQQCVHCFITNREQAAVLGYECSSAPAPNPTLAVASAVKAPPATPDDAPEGCPSCGALPCDWATNPYDKKASGLRIAHLMEGWPLEKLDEVLREWTALTKPAAKPEKLPTAAVPDSAELADLRAQVARMTELAAILPDIIGALRHGYRGVSSVTSTKVRQKLLPVLTWAARSSCGVPLDGEPTYRHVPLSGEQK